MSIHSHYHYPEAVRPRHASQALAAMAGAMQTFSVYLQCTAKALDEGGERHLILQILRKLCPTILVLRVISFYRRDLDENLPEPKAIPGFHLRQASAAELKLLAELYPDKSMESLRARFQRGDLCFVAIDTGGKIAHARWVTVQRAYIPELDREVVLSPGEAYFYDGYTHPDRRGRGIDGAVRAFLFKTMRGAGCRRVYSYVRGDNPVGQRAAQRWQQRAGRLWCLRLGRFSPLLLGSRSPNLPILKRRAKVEREEEERSFRARVWRQWFESWLHEPPEKRSTGYHALPEEYFISTADYIASVLQLDPKSDVVLDVGCDSAMVSRLVGPRCRGFVGADLIVGMLTDTPRDAVKTASGKPASLAAADGRFLPFRSGTFTKVYCSGVVHTLPSHADGLKMVEEMVRVCRPGGRVLVAAVPDTAKRFRQYREVWKRANPRERMRLAVSLATPRVVKELLRRLLGISRGDRLLFLEYDFRELKLKLEAQGLECQVLDFPESYWSADFRKTRTNLLLRLPDADQRKSAPEKAPLVHLDLPS